MNNEFLPITRLDMQNRNWDTLDFVIISGDAYVDHPSFGTAIIGRVLESKGFKVGIIPQPDWNNIEDFRKLGKPDIAFLVTSGNIDSMVNHYTVAKKRRKTDQYSPGGKGNLRPDRATTVYSQKAREAYNDVPIIIGGVEGSLRRLSHYDYWDDKVRRSILLDSKADLLVYGMAETQIIEIAEALQSGLPMDQITFIKGTAYRSSDISHVVDFVMLPSYEKISKSKEDYCKHFMIQHKNTDSITAKPLVEPYEKSKTYVVQNTPADPLDTSTLDWVYSLPYTKQFHPIYEKDGGIPALTEVKFSLVSSRGCFGGCSFCALNFHQGRAIQPRSSQSIVNEAKQMVWEPDFKGYIHDVGGPTANFRQKACEKQIKHGVCSNKQCLFPNPCKNLNIDHTEYLDLLRELRTLPNVKKVFVRSGIRYDYLVHDQNQEFFKELCEHHVSGQLKVAPEHISPRVLEKMGKPGRDVYEKFVNKYERINNKVGKNQFLVPYLMSSHPGSDLHAAIELAEYLRDIGHNPEQVQDFYPTPGTLSTCMYYTEMDPRTMERVYVPKTAHEKAMQRALMQYRDPNNYELVYEALTKAKRKDLIGFDKKCLIRPRANRSSFTPKPKPKPTGKSDDKKPSGRPKDKRGKGKGSGPSPSPSPVAKNKRQPNKKSR
ncbi:YgiQ family radical SAM protein [Alkalicella caledoniensis]|uniref:YgiQ family radical SAM protein n=1 Tax=Alkalicella caledoniensis TaxID=2731377 RepID=A0A7G9WBH6_ALKCA|nr:YgiQ family radical SAM protein [Alkalicella caledoniensis]QNO16038.1 YgiQ family radical SAM protein [Alkalicella caledoniensis]